MRNIFLALPAFIILGLFACRKDSGKSFSDEPQITYKGISNNRINFFDTGVACNITLDFTDGDGNIGHTEDSVITIQDYRSDTLYRSYLYPFPVIGDEFRDHKWLEGTVLITLNTVFFTPRLDSLHLAEKKDTLYYKIFIKDEAGNVSNTVKTDTIYVRGD